MFKILTAVLVILLVLFISLLQVWGGFLYFFLVCLDLLCIDIFVWTIFCHKDLNKALVKEYKEIHLAELYNAGKITKEQFEVKDMKYFKRYKKRFRSEKYKYIALYFIASGIIATSIYFYF